VLKATQAGQCVYARKRKQRGSKLQPRSGNWVDRERIGKSRDRTSYQVQHKYASLTSPCDDILYYDVDMQVEYVKASRVC